MERYKDLDGYGYASRYPTPGVVKAHRFAYEITFGRIPRGKHVLHKCDTRSCVNPGHLELGTQKSNMAQKAARGRCNSVRGERHYRAKLTADEVLLIRESDRPQDVLAGIFEVSQAHISRIQTGEVWGIYPVRFGAVCRSLASRGD